MRTFAIGDVHGCSTALKTLLDFTPFGPEDKLVMLGDYVDRGPDTRGVIERLISLRKERNVVCLRGNHEVMMLLARHNRTCLLDWLECGGDAVLASYVGLKIGQIPAEHWKFLEDTLPYHENEEHIFVHASVDPELPMAEQPDFILYWERFWSAKPHQSGKKVICGHTPQRDGVPVTYGHTTCIDTFACGGAWLTCLEPATGKYWQANQKAETREGEIVRTIVDS